MPNTSNPEQPSLQLGVEVVQGGLQVTLVTAKLKSVFIIDEGAVEPLCRALREAAKSIPKIVLPG